MAVFGTGVSVALTDRKIPTMSWRGLIEDGFAHAAKKGKITAEQVGRWKSQLASGDLDELLGAAEFMGRKLDAPNGDLYARWLEGVFKSVRSSNEELSSAIRALASAKVPLCTLNYDPLLEHVTGQPSITVSETSKATAWARREAPGVLHLHGYWASPATCVLGIRDYEGTQHDDVRDLLQRHLASFRRLLFIGCGDTFGDPNFSALVKWLRQNMKAAAPEHYALVPDDQVTARNRDEAWHGFVEPVGYGKYSGLAAFLLKHFKERVATESEKKSVAVRVPETTTPSHHMKLIQDYRAFLIRDCGQMTIEGVRAELDTAKSKFDLERLFVPLKLLPSVPEISETDPLREQKLMKWAKKERKPRPFGSIFQRTKRIALLALPGGGKSLLLKRLAVAYADPARRTASGDGLPELNLTPVLIRCREWREHIHRPLATLLKSIPDITGQPGLSGLGDALEPLFKQGQILLLVDGLDEIHDDGLRTTFVEQLERFLEEHERTRLVVTSREAGFALIAPNIARFSQRWTIAPLEEDAITDLCTHWHRLMAGESPSALKEAQEVSQHLIGNDSLRRLAENPLLLTMLLVVKHGAGRLPPDRVSLYSRAVEVLLDTWNIKGHEPLNPREAVPQLACVAFELMRQGKQTATKGEFLSLLEDARERVSQIRRYAKDTPDQFLKRVELRSSLVVEAGHQVENGLTVPFYQFRHLTFQEYLAAVAAAEGHYMAYQKGDSVLTPLEPYLTAPEWKEVIPMSAVLARKQAEPLLAALVSQANDLRHQLERGEPFPERDNWLRFPPLLPHPVGRLLQCLVEEAEPAPDTLTQALQAIVLFARGCDSLDPWRTFATGPYGDEAVRQSLKLYLTMRGDWDDWSYDFRTCSTLLGLRRPESFWQSAQGPTELSELICGEGDEQIIEGLATLVGMWKELQESPLALTIAQETLGYVEKHLFDERVAVRRAGTWAWGLYHYYAASLSAEPRVLDRLAHLWLHEPKERGITSFALLTQFGRPQASWKPTLTAEETNIVRDTWRPSSEKPGYEAVAEGCVLAFLAFHAEGVCPDDEIASRLTYSEKYHPPFRIKSSDDSIKRMLKELTLDRASAKTKK